MLQKSQKHGKLLVVKNGYLECPYCRMNHRVTRVPRTASGVNIPAYCRTCKREFNIDFEQGQCFESQGQ